MGDRIRRRPHMVLDMWKEVDAPPPFPCPFQCGFADLHLVLGFIEHLECFTYKNKVSQYRLIVFLTAGLGQWDKLFGKPANCIPTGLFPKQMDRRDPTQRPACRVLSLSGDLGRAEPSKLLKFYE